MTAARTSGRRRRHDSLTYPDAIEDQSAITAQYLVAPVDRLAAEMSLKWGEDVLAELVPLDLAERFGRQREKFENAIAARPVDLDTLRTEAQRMQNAWRALDAAAEAANAPRAVAEAWEFVGEDGKPCALVRDPRTWKLYAERHPDRRIYTLEEAGRVLTSPHLRVVSEVKDAFPGATVSAVRPPRSRMGDFIEDEIPDWSEPA